MNFEIFFNQIRHRFKAIQIQFFLGCFSVDDYPTMLSNLITLEDSSSTTVETPSDSNALSPQPTKFTNVNAEKITVRFESKYQFPGTVPARPAFITGFSIGMVEASTIIQLERGNYSGLTTLKC